MITTVLFDIGGVLITPSERITPFLLSEVTKIPLEKTMAIYSDEKQNLQLGYKKLGDIIALLGVDNLFQRSVLEMENDYISLYEKQAVIDEQMLHLVANLTAKYHVCAFSNMIGIHAQANTKRGLFQNFHKTFFSSDMKAVKPDIEAYTYVINSLRQPPSDCLYIEDDAVNLEAGKKVGFTCIKFDSSINLIGNLKKMNLL